MTAMNTYHHCSTPQSETRSVLDIGNIFREHQASYREEHRLNLQQSQALGAIAVCRTAKLGGHTQQCSECDYAVPVYNSCRNRHCPKCQGLQQAAWIQGRIDRILPTHYFHVVITLPDALRPLVRSNPDTLLDALIRTAADTLQILGKDPKRLGGQLGITIVLHTWSRTLQYHPHVHCIVSGGALSAEGDKWLPAKFLFPARTISRLFRGRFIHFLVRSYNAGKLNFQGSCADLTHPHNFKKLKKVLYAKDWVAYAKRPFGGAVQIFSYLGRYTHRVGISNHRLRRITPTEITFATKDGKEITLTSHEFIRRFLLHVLPRRFVKIRHYGLFAARHAKGRLITAKHLLAELQKPSIIKTPHEHATTAALSLPQQDVESHAATTSIEAPISQNQDQEATGTWDKHLLALTGINVAVCPSCKGRLIRRPIPR